MKVELVKLDQFTGDKAKIYSVAIDDNEETLFEQFINDNIENHRKEVMDIYIRLQTMSSDFGARENYFKLNEGNLGDGVAAIYDIPGKNLRLYCIRYGTATVILGGGGVKSKSIRAYQEDSLLNSKATIMKKISILITEHIKSKEFSFEEDGTILCDIIMEE